MGYVLTCVLMCILEPMQCPVVNYQKGLQECPTVMLGGSFQTMKESIAFLSVCRGMQNTLQCRERWC